MRFPAAAFAAALSIAAAHAQPAPDSRSITVRSSPERPYAEPTGSGIAVNGDLVVDNKTAREYELVAIHMDARDAQGRLLQRRELNANGVAPGILTVPQRKLEKSSSLLVFNPFASFAADIPVARLDVRLGFRDLEDKSTADASVTVIPKPAPAQAFRLPMSGRVLVWDGHDLHSHHRRWNYMHPGLMRLGYKGNAGRYALDLIAVDEEGRRSSGDEADNRNWTSFGKPVVAPADGAVVAMQGAAADDRTFRYGPGMEPNAPFGNYVVLRHDDGTFSLLGHLMQGSITVKVGDGVRAGAGIARVGASGDSLFPHLHYQRADGPDDFAEGIPVRWRGVKRAIGASSAPLANGYLDSGDIVFSE